MQQRQQSSVLKEENMDTTGKLMRRKKNYTTALIVSCDEVFTCFLFWSKKDQDIYHVEQTFRGTWFLADFEDFSKDLWHECEKKRLRKLTPPTIWRPLFFRSSFRLQLSFTIIIRVKYLISILRYINARLVCVIKCWLLKLLLNSRLYHLIMH